MTRFCLPRTFRAIQQCKVATLPSDAYKAGQEYASSDGCLYSRQCPAVHESLVYSFNGWRFAAIRLLPLQGSKSANKKCPRYAL